MVRKQLSSGDREASLHGRRGFLKAVGGVAASVGLGAIGTGAGAQTNEPDVDAIAAETDHAWTTVELSGSHSDPVVVAPSLSYRGWNPSTPRVRNVASDAFELAVEEWRYRDGAHRVETVGCLAVDPGSYRLADGASLEAGRVRTDHGWERNEFSASFSATPVVFSGAQTVNGSHPVTTRHSNVSDAGMYVRLQEEEAEGPHRVEEVGYLAVDPGSGTLSGRAYEAGVREGVDHDWQTVEFSTAFQEPVFLADLQTTYGGNTAAVRYRNLGGSSVEVRVEEERSADRETGHVGERVGYLVVEGAAVDAGGTDDTGDTPLSELDRSRVERLVHEHVNERRAEHGLGALEFDTALREIARYHSEDMAENDYFSHTSPDGETRSDRYDRFGYDCRADTGDGTYYTGGENIAYTYYDTRVRTSDGVVRYTTADELARGLVRGWMNSQGHRENILTEAWDHEGIGVAITSDGKVYATQNFC